MQCMRLLKTAPSLGRALSMTASSRSVGVAVPTGESSTVTLRTTGGPTGGVTASELSDEALINEGIPPEHLVAPYGDPNKMLGQSGKLIDKLPKGTKVGHLVMGDYGLYSPEFRKFQLTLLRASKAGTGPYTVFGMRDELAMGVVLWGGVFCLLMGLYNLYTSITKTYPSLYTFGVVPEKFQKKK